jgi:hypothetical protein
MATMDVLCVLACSEVAMTMTVDWMAEAAVVV